MGEQLRRLDALGIPYTITPGVPAFAAAAAALGRELTVPEVGQSLVLTRTSGRASAMPETERLAAFAQTRATLAIHLSIHVIEQVVEDLLPFYGADCPAAVVWRASWPDERVIKGTLGDDRRHGPRREAGAHGADPGRADACGKRFSRQRALFDRLRPPLPSRCPRSGR